MDYIDRLCTIYTNWCEKEKVEPDSADTILAWGDITEKQRKFHQLLKRLIQMFLKTKQKQKTKSKQGIFSLVFQMWWFETDENTNNLKGENNDKTNIQ